MAIAAKGIGYAQRNEYYLRAPQGGHVHSGIYAAEGVDTGQNTAPVSGT